MPQPRLSFRAQFVLILVFCLALTGTGMVFLNSYLIAVVKERLRRGAVDLALEQAQNISSEIAGALGADGLRTLDGGGGLQRRLEIYLRRNDNVVAACLVDENGNVLVSNAGEDPDLLELSRNDQTFEALIQSGDFDEVRVRMRSTHPEMRMQEVPIEREGLTVGRLKFLISESAIYGEIAQDARQITRLLWSTVLAFVGVLALGLYLTARLFRRQMQLMEENERLDRMAYVGTLAAGLAHEIRNPLNAMSMNLSVAEEEIAAGEEGSPEVTAKAVRILQREVSRLDRSVTSFMQFARPEADRRERTELTPLLEEVLELLRPQIDEADVALDVRVPPDAWLEADFSGLRQVVYNVVLNALQAMQEVPPEARRIVVGARRESAQWFLWIEDAGPGIPAGQEEKAFEVFHTTKAAGSGFGLAIAREIVRSHDGDIRARRGAELGGTRIEITLPETAPRSARGPA